MLNVNNNLYTNYSISKVEKIIKNSLLNLYVLLDKNKNSKVENFFLEIKKIFGWKYSKDDEGNWRNVWKYNKWYQK